MKKVTNVLGAFALVLTLAATVALADSKLNPQIYPPNSAPFGEPYGAWGDAWWQWAFSVPAAQNPVADTTGKYAAEGQPGGPVWFLAGTFGVDAVRNVTVPAGKALFFPIVNQVWVNLPAWGDNLWSKDQESFARDLVGAVIDQAWGLACEIDGTPVARLAAYRCKTPKDATVMTWIPEGDIWGLVGGTDVNGDIFQAGSYGPTVQDGIYLMLAPLSPGAHTIHFAAGMGDTFHIDVTYYLTVQ